MFNNIYSTLNSLSRSKNKECPIFWSSQKTKNYPYTMEDLMTIKSEIIEIRENTIFIIRNTGELIACDTYSDYLAILDDIRDRDIYN